MTRRHLEIFSALCANGGKVTQTAKQLHLTQPAVSRAISELEAYYGVKLFDRIAKRLYITPAGERMLEYARRIGGLFGEMERGLRDWDTLGLLRVGASLSIGTYLAPLYAKAFEAACPGVQLQMTVAETPRLEQMVLDSRLDLALVEGPVHHTALREIEFMEDTLCIAAAAGGEFTDGQMLTHRQFLQQRLLLREQGSGTREFLERAAAAIGLQVTASWESVSTDALLRAVQQGLGIAVLPGRAAEEAHRRGEVCLLEVEGLQLRRSYRIVYHKDKLLSDHAKAFLQLCSKADGV